MRRDTETQQTYLVRLWVANDEGIYDHVQTLVEEAGNVVDGGDSIQDYIEEEAEIVLDTSTGLFNDLLGHALRNVDWVAVARAFKPDDWDGDEAPDEDEEDEE